MVNDSYIVFIINNKLSRKDCRLIWLLKFFTHCLKVKKADYSVCFIYWDALFFTLLLVQYLQ
jgi:hypothetical protein